MANFVSFFLQIYLVAGQAPIGSLKVELSQTKVTLILKDNVMDISKMAIVDSDVQCTTLAEY